MVDLSSLLAFGFPVLLIVAGLVEFSKKLGAAGNLCIVLAVVYAVALMLLVQLAAAFPLIEPWIKTVITGLIVGLSASGLYDLAKTFKPA
jgi:hypothetical protein